MIICISALFALSLSLWAQGHPSGPEKDTAQIQEEAAVDVHEGQGRIVRGFYATFPLDASHAEFADVFAFFDPATGAFWWKETGRFANSEVSSNAVENFLKFVSVRIADKKLVVFWTTDMPATLVVKESMLRVDKLEDAWRVVKQEVPHQRYGLWAEDDPKAGVHVIPLQKLLKEEFFVPKGYEHSAMWPTHPPEIRAIEHRDSQWQITLGGVNGLTAELVRAHATTLGVSRTIESLIATSTIASRPELASASVSGSGRGYTSIGNHGTPARKIPARQAG